MAASSLISKRDVPIYGHPIMWAMVLLGVISVIVGLRSEGDLHPGVLEVCVGVAWSIPFCRYYVSAQTRFIEAMALQSREHRSLRWWPAASGPEWASNQVASLLLAVGVVLANLTVLAVWRMFPWIGAPWANFGDDPGQSMAVATSTFCLVTVVIDALAQIIWYRNLPDGGA